MNLLKRNIHLPNFNELRLIKPLNQYLKSVGIFTPTAIQHLTIPHVIGNNYVNFQITGQTGTGKTLAFLLPALNILKTLELQEKRQLTLPSRPSSLIIQSSRELVQQTAGVSKDICHVCKLSTSMLGVHKRSRQLERVQEGVDVLVSTMQAFERARGKVYLSNIKVLIIDQADTLLDSGLQDHLLQLVLNYKQLQLKCLQTQVFIPKILFVSATYTKKLSDFLDQAFRNYKVSDRKHLDIETQEKVFKLKRIHQSKAHLNLQNIQHQFQIVKGQDKLFPFLQILKKELKRLRGQGSVIIFCNSVASLHKLDYFLAEHEIRSVSLHGDIPKKIRQSNYLRFKNKTSQILLATDLGSRGLDFPFVQLVINFDFPKCASDYLHRVGRTGRAGKPGKAISLYKSPDLAIINQLKQSYQTKKPLDINGSAYALKNREELARRNIKRGGLKRKAAVRGRSRVR